jgi:hypothetical protein
MIAGLPHIKPYVPGPSYAALAVQTGANVKQPLRFELVERVTQFQANTAVTML